MESMTCQKVPSFKKGTLQTAPAGIKTSQPKCSRPGYTHWIGQIHGDNPLKNNDPDNNEKWQKTNEREHNVHYLDTIEARA
jgi:hypothetical protein